MLKAIIVDSLGVSSPLFGLTINDEGFVDLIFN